MECWNVMECWKVVMLWNVGMFCMECYGMLECSGWNVGMFWNVGMLWNVGINVIRYKKQAETSDKSIADTHCSLFKNTVFSTFQQKNSCREKS